MDFLNPVSFLFFPLWACVLLLILPLKSKASQSLNIVLHVIWAVFTCLFLKSLPDSTEVFAHSMSFPFLSKFGSSFTIALDNISIPLVVLNIFLSTSLSFYALGKDKLNRYYLALFFLLNFASIGSLMAVDALVFYIFWELMLIPLFFLVGVWGGEKRVYAAFKFFACTFFGSLFLLLAMLALKVYFGAASFSWFDLKAISATVALEPKIQLALFAAFMLAFLVKIPAWPVHTWLPDAHTQAPTGASVILAGVLLKLGVYGIFRWTLPLFPEAAVASSDVLMTLAVFGIILGSFGAWRQTDIKRLIAYSSVGHLGFVILGIFALRSAPITGALFQNIAHGLSTGAMFLIFGIIYDRTHSRKMSEYGGLAKAQPWLASCFVLAAMAGVGLPGLPGFIGEFLILTGSYMSRPVFAIIALSGVLLGAIYTLKLVRASVWGEVSDLIKSHPIKVTWNEWVAVVPFVLAMLFYGLQPQGFIESTSPLVDEMLKVFK